VSAVAVPSAQQPTSVGSTATLPYAWSAWYPLAGAGSDCRVPAAAGLYRLRRVGREDLDYVGQTGGSLRARLGMLRGIYAPEMPYRDPHTAGPALWALRDAATDGGAACVFEASVAPLARAAPERKGWEAVALALYRQRWGRSPTVSFGRMPAGYRMSSGNNARLVATGQRFRGGRWAATLAAHLPGCPPAGPLGDDPQALVWGGHRWSPWMPLTPSGGALRNLPPTALGLYRLRAAAGAGCELIYVGEGRIRARLMVHWTKAVSGVGTQGRVFLAAAPLEASWVLHSAWHHHERLELESDLIADHLLTTGHVPAAQFLG
jgi:hypothetical protein